MHPLVKTVRINLQAASDPQKATQMQAYMKTTQSFYGVQSAQRKTIFREAKKCHPITTCDEYESVVLDLWRGDSREEMYMALEVAEGYRSFHNDRFWDLYADLVHTASNWDTLDWLASRIVGPLILKNRTLEAELINWSCSEVMWVRRASLLSHLKHGGDTNLVLLETTILKLAPEKEFFIRKAIGWILRDYSYAGPDWVTAFVERRQDVLSGLSQREAMKHIKRRTK